MKFQLLAALCLSLASCGYSAGLRAPEGYSTIGLEFFGNDSDLRDLEADLYQAISLSLNQLVGTPLAAPGEANLVVRGNIIEYRRRGGARDENNLRQETGVRLTVEAYLWNRRTGARVGSISTSEIETGYTVGQGSFDTSTIDETVRDPNLERANELNARARALRLTAEKLVFELFATPTAAVKKP